jgi:hypothetical protein
MVHRLSPDQQTIDRNAATAFIDACRSGNAATLAHAVELLNDTSINGWRLAFMRAAKLKSVSSATQRAFMKEWIQDKTIRRRIGNDFLALAGLHVLLPPYDGPDTRLFRGETFDVHRRRLYGMSWTDDLATAVRFALESRQLAAGGSVVLKTLAPSAAIIATTYSIEDPYGEHEYLVDRRKLKLIEVHLQFPQLLRGNSNSQAL